MLVFSSNEIEPKSSVINCDEKNELWANNFYMPIATPNLSIHMMTNNIYEREVILGTA